MDISFLGLGCVRLKARDAAVICDPFTKTGALSMGKVTADVVTISHQSPRAANAEGVGGEPRVIDRPGEYEVSGVTLVGLAGQTLDGARNSVFVIDLEDISVGHLGGIGADLTADQMQQLGTCQVVIAPVGGVDTLPVERIVEIVNQIEPRVLIPVGFKDAMAGVEAQDLEVFLKAMGLKEVEPRPRLQLTKSTLPAELQVVLLNR